MADYNDILFNSLMGVAQIRGQEKNQKIASDAEARMKIMSDIQAKILQDNADRQAAQDQARKKLIPAPTAVPGTFDEKAYQEAISLGVDPTQAAMIQGRITPEDAIQAFKVNQQLLPGANNLLQHSAQLDQLDLARKQLATNTALEVKKQFPNADQKFLSQLIDDPTTYRDPIRLILGAQGMSNDSATALAARINAAANYQQAKAQGELALLTRNAAMLKAQGMDVDKMIAAYNGAVNGVAAFGKTLADMAAADIKPNSPEFQAVLKNMLAAGASVNALSDTIFSQKLDPRMVTNIPPEEKSGFWKMIQSFYLGGNANADMDKAALALADGQDPSKINMTPTPGPALPLSAPPTAGAPTPAQPTQSLGGGQPAPAPTADEGDEGDAGDIGGTSLGPIPLNVPASERPALLPMLPPQVTPQVLFRLASANPAPPTREEVAQVFFLVNEHPAEALAQARILLLRTGHYPASYAYNAPDDKVFASLNAMLQNLRN